MHDSTDFPPETQPPRPDPSAVCPFCGQTLTPFDPRLSAALEWCATVHEASQALHTLLEEMIP
jgi:hypothetical protein